MRIALFLTFCLNFSDIFSVICREKYALTSIDVIVSRQNGLNHQLSNVNLYSLDQYDRIEVIGSNLSQLCEGSIKQFSNLKILTIINQNLTDIQPGTFQQLPHLHSLSLSVNQLTDVKRGVFDPIKSLHTLYLNHNQIEIIDDGAFAMLPLLKRLYLNHNKLTSLSGNIAFGTPLLQLIDYSYNQIVYVTTSSFDDLRPVAAATAAGSLEIRLARNRLVSVSQVAVAQLPVACQLHFEHNQLSETDFDVRDGSDIYLSHNSVQCLTADTVQRLRVRKIHLHVTDNPIACACVTDLYQQLTGTDLMGRVELVTSLPCYFKSFTSY